MAIVWAIFGHLRCDVVFKFRPPARVGHVLDGAHHVGS